MKFKLISFIFLNSLLFSFCQEKSVKPYKILKGHKHKVQGAFFSKNGDIIISYGWDNTVRIWDVNTFKEIRTLKGHTDQVWCAAVSPDYKYVASGSMDRSFIIWELKTGNKLQQVKISPSFVIEKGIIPEFDREIQNSIYRVSFSPDGKKLAVASADRLVRIWDMERSVFTDTLDGQCFTNWMAAQYSPDGKYLITTSHGTPHTEGVKVIWETETYKQVKRIVMSGDILFTENNELGIYTGKNIMNLYNLSDGDLTGIETFPDYKGNFNLSPDKKFMVSCNEDSYIILRNVATQKVVWTYQHESLEIHTAHFSPDGKYLIAGTPESDIFIWKLNDLVEEQNLNNIK
jgi:WD40 repeat protein